MITDSNWIRETKATEAPQLSSKKPVRSDGEGKGDNGYFNLIHFLHQYIFKSIISLSFSDNMSEPSILRFENGDLDNNQTQTNRFEFVFSNLPNVTYTLYEVNLTGISLMNPESPTLFKLSLLWCRFSII